MKGGGEVGSMKPIDQILKENAKHEPCVRKAGMSYCYYCVIFCKNSNQVLYLGICGIYLLTLSELIPVTHFSQSSVL